jgi:adenine phosphoribosyltransferase
VILESSTLAGAEPPHSFRTLDEALESGRALKARLGVRSVEELRALSAEELVSAAGGNIVGKMTILAEGDAQEREDIIYLEKLPLFNAKGDIIG